MFTVIFCILQIVSLENYSITNSLKDLLHQHFNFTTTHAKKILKDLNLYGEKDLILV